jgi:hypothetical protein
VTTSSSASRPSPPGGLRPPLTPTPGAARWQGAGRRPRRPALWSARLGEARTVIFSRGSSSRRASCRDARRACTSRRRSWRLLPPCSRSYTRSGCRIHHNLPAHLPGKLRPALDENAAMLGARWPSVNRVLRKLQGRGVGSFASTTGASRSSIRQSSGPSSNAPDGLSLIGRRRTVAYAA